MSAASRSCPLTEPGDTGIARCDSLNQDGRGVARVDGKTTFIDGALPGERVRFRYLRRRARYDTAALLEVLEPSPDRVTPPCPHFGVCGGCSEQHLAPAAQVRAKERVLAETLAHVGKVAPARWLEPITGPVAGYRRRARLGVRLVPKKGGVLVGFRERRRSYVTPLAACVTLDPGFSALLPALRALIAGLSRPDRLPQVELAAGDRARALVFRHLEPLTEADRAQLRAFAQAHGIAVYLQPGGPQTVAPLWPVPPPALEYALPAFDLRLAFGPTDFVQVNGAVNRLLVERALALLAPAPDEHVTDLFCGLGNFTLALARTAGAVTGVEADPGLVARARANAARNGIANARFQEADLYGERVAGLWAGERCDKLLLDPPRAGAMEVLKALPDPAPARIVYVSCNPATLARDSSYLVHARGYRLEAAGIADMFPHTSHVESLALFEVMSGHGIEIDIGSQLLQLRDSGGRVVLKALVSTARNGAGERYGSECTPRGRHQIRARIGGGQPLGAVFVSRRPTGEIYSPALRAAYPERDWILTRILWLSGLEPGRNRLGPVDTMRRYIYIHGCPDEDPMGVPGSHGCIKMRNADVVRLYELVAPGTPVLIRE